MEESVNRCPRVTRIAMWSGPRNISTAMLRSWENRPDTVVCDEPFYAHYLKVTKLAHPGADEVIAHHESDDRRVVEWLLSDPPPGKSVFYQKQMAHHLLPGMDRSWLDRMTHGFLIREPAAMLTSLLHFLPEPRLVDTGLPQQWELFQRVKTISGRVPPVLDARDVLEKPEGMLRAFCASVGVPWDKRMLSWPPGPRETDGVWAKYWYAAVEKSTTFERYRPKEEKVPPRLADLLRQAEEIYERLHAERLSPHTPPSAG